MSNNIIGNPLGFCNLQLSDQEIQSLMQILSFASNTATFIAGQEMVSKTSAGTLAAATYNRIALDANDLIKIISASVAIGEPPTTEPN